jgi:hypothetical protein
MAGCVTFGDEIFVLDESVWGRSRRTRENRTSLPVLPQQSLLLWPYRLDYSVSRYARVGIHVGQAVLTTGETPK